MPTRSLRLLLIEDSEEDELLLLRELARAGYQVEHRRVCTPEDVRAAMTAAWDVAISDWSMPRLDGLEAYRIVRAFDREVPFIIVSGTIGEEIAVDALKAGVDDFMSKGKFARLGPAIERARNAAQVRRHQRETAAELERRRKEIERSEKLLRIVLDSVPDAVIVADHDGRILASNPAASDHLGISPRDHDLASIDRSYELLLPDKVTPLPSDQRPLPSALRGDSIDRQELFVRTHESNALRFMRITARPFSHASGINGAIAVFHDISRERAAQEQLLISDRMASVGMLAAGVAHEINNPLAAVFANVEMIASTLAEGAVLQASDLAEVQQMLDDALSSADRVRRIVKDLRIFSRHEEEELRAVDLRATLESTLRMARNEIRHRARLVTAYADDLLVRGSESRLGQVFLNLIVNAAQSIPEGKADRNTIRIATERSDGMAIIEVSDTGAGMSPDVQLRLFTPFFSTKPQGEGTGLGLAIAHRIVTGLGGWIDVQSSVGEGSTFRVALPVAAEASEPRTTVAPPMTASRRARILVVDDEVMVGVAIRRLLAREHDVYAVTRATEAVERLRSGERFDVIVCDLMMPEMTGMEFYAEVASLEQADRIVFLTGGAFTPSARHFLDGIPNQWIEKPFDAKGLRAMINDRAK